MAQVPSAPALPVERSGSSFRPVESGRVNVHDGAVRAGVEQKHNGFSVHRGVEQDHAVDAMERYAVHAACFLCKSERRKQKQKQNDVAYCVAYQPGERGLTRENEGD